MKSLSALAALLSFFSLITLPALAQQQQIQRLEVCTPTGLTADAKGLTEAQKRELATLCITYYYGAFLCAPVKAVAETFVSYGKLYRLGEKDIDPVAFAAKGSWLAHVKNNAQAADLLGAQKVQERLNNWTQVASVYFTKTVNEGKKLTGPMLLAYIRGPEFSQFCPHIKP
jgi:hypothetical protein